MGRAPCCDKEGLKKGPWTPEEDKILVDYIQAHGHGSWRSLPKLAGLLRCGKSCRLRWTNYLRPDIKRGPFTPDEQKSIIQLHGIVGNKWSTIASQLPGRTDNEVKNYWNTHLKKHIIKMGLDPDTYAPASSSPSSPASTTSPSAAAASSSSATPPSSSSAARHMAQWESARLEAEARLSGESLLHFPAATADVSSSYQSESAKSQAEADVFLRIWNSEVGEAFRSKEDPAVMSASSPASSSSLTKCGKKECCVGSGGVAEEEVDAEPKSSSLDEVVDDASEESYQLYLDFAASDDMSLCIGGLFHSQFGGFSLFGGGDLSVETLDSAFKWDGGERTRV